MVLVFDSLIMNDLSKLWLCSDSVSILMLGCLVLLWSLQQALMKSLNLFWLAPLIGRVECLVRPTLYGGGIMNFPKNLIFFPITGCFCSSRDFFLWTLLSQWNSLTRYTLSIMCLCFAFCDFCQDPSEWQRFCFAKDRWVTQTHPTDSLYLEGMVSVSI